MGDTDVDDGTIVGQLRARLIWHANQVHEHATAVIRYRQALDRCDRQEKP